MSSIFNKILFTTIDLVFDLPQNGLNPKIKGITKIKNVPYVTPFEKLQKLDIYTHNDDIVRPTIIYIHGGGFVKGDKYHRRKFCYFLANQNYNVISLNYRLAPKTKFSGAIADFDNALNFIKDNANKYNVDLSSLIIAGDSSGGYFAGLISAITTNEQLKNAYDFTFDIPFKKAIFNCGLFNLNTALKQKSVFNISNGICVDLFGLKSNEIQNYRLYDYISTDDYITKDFPESFVIYAKQDVFCKNQANELIEKLKINKVKYTEFYSTSFKNNHCFSLNFHNKQAKECNKLLVDFLKN